MHIRRQMSCAAGQLSLVPRALRKPRKQFKAGFCTRSLNCRLNDRHQGRCAL